MTDFERLYKSMPALLHSSYDPLEHTTISDLRWLALHEIDLYQEGEDTDINTQREYESVRRFMVKCEKYL